MENIRIVLTPEGVVIVENLLAENDRLRGLIHGLEHRIELLEEELDGPTGEIR